MKFPERGSEQFSDEEIERLETWKQNVEQTPTGKRIIENFEKDPHVPDKIWIRFLKNLLAFIKEGNNDLDSIRKSITDDMLLKGPDVDEDELGDSLLRLMTMKVLMKYYLKENVPIFKDKKSEEQVGEWLNDGTISIEKHLKNVKLRGARPIVWATFAVPVENYYNMNLNIDDLCDRLGLRDFNKCDYVVKVLYNLNKIEKLRLPNIIDAGVNPAFFPSGEEDQIGYTHDLRNNLGGFPEIVHEPIAIKKIDSIGYLGHKTRNASSKIFEENRKGE